MPLRGPVLGRGTPVRSQQGVGLLHQGGQGLVRLGPAVQVVGHLALAVQVVEARAQRLRIGQRIVAHHHARGFHQAGLGVAAPGGRKRRG